MSKEKKFVLTEWGCLHNVLLSHGVNIDHISGLEGMKMVEEFMEALCDIGYAEKVKKKGKKKK